MNNEQFEVFLDQQDGKSKKFWVVSIVGLILWVALTALMVSIVITPDGDVNFFVLSSISLKLSTLAGIIASIVAGLLVQWTKILWVNDLPEVRALGMFQWGAKDKIIGVIFMVASFVFPWIAIVVAGLAILIALIMAIKIADDSDQIRNELRRN